MDKSYKPMQTVVSAWPATTAGGIKVGDCDKSAEAYHRHSLVWKLKNVRAPSRFIHNFLFPVDCLYCTSIKEVGWRRTRAACCHNCSLFLPVA